MIRAEESEIAIECMENEAFIYFCRYLHAECLHERSLNNDPRNLEFYEYYFGNFEYLLKEYTKNMEKGRI